MAWLRTAESAAVEPTSMSPLSGHEATASPNFEAPQNSLSGDEATASPNFEAPQNSLSGDEVTASPNRRDCSDGGLHFSGALKVLSWHALQPSMPKL